jgi:hypothetical protein
MYMLLQYQKTFASILTFLFILKIYTQFSIISLSKGSSKIAQCEFSKEPFFCLFFPTYFPVYSGLRPLSPAHSRPYPRVFFPSSPSLLLAVEGRTQLSPQAKMASLPPMGKADFEA